MARKTKAPQANQKVVLECIQPKCPNCGHSVWSDYDNDRTIRTLSGVVQLTLKGLFRVIIPERLDIG